MGELKWFENPAFWRDMSAKIYTPDKQINAEDEAIQALRLLQIQSPSRVLDMCCARSSQAMFQTRRQRQALNAPTIHFFPFC
jgi:hypothetical protein